MKVLVLGSGGREHALAWKIGQSPRVDKVFCAPGNAGICQAAECHSVDLGDAAAVVELASKLKPDLTVVGPELPLTAGVVDEFQQRGLPIFGPTRAAAQLESSKIFAKEFMLRYNMPTVHFAICATSADVTDALAHLH